LEVFLIIGVYWVCCVFGAATLYFILMESSTHFCGIIGKTDTNRRSGTHGFSIGFAVGWVCLSS